MRLRRVASRLARTFTPLRSPSPGGVTVHSRHREPELNASASFYAPDPVRPDWNSFPRQGALGNCWIMAPMLAVYCANPEFFRDSVRLCTIHDGPKAPHQRDTNSGAHTRHFRASRADSTPGASRQYAWARVFRRGTPVWFRLPLWFPVRADGTWAYAVEESSRTPGWPGLIEKAAVLCVAGSYRWAAIGLASVGFPLVCGVSAPTLVRMPSARVFSEWLADGRAVVASTHPLTRRWSQELHDAATGAPLSPFPPNHVFAVTEVDLSRGFIGVRNPWRPAELVWLSRSDMRRLFVSVNVTRTAVR